MPDALRDFHEELFQDVLARADAGGAFLEDSFFEVFTEYLVDAGEIETADRAFYLGARGVRVDGYGGDPRDSDGVLVLLVSDFQQSDDLETLTASELTAINNRVVNFAKKARDVSFRDSLEEATPYYGLADTIASTWSSINKIRILLMSNRLLSSRVDGVPASDIDGVPVTYNVWDLGRLHRYVLVGREREDIEIDLVGDFGGAVPALPASLSGADYEAYLLVMPGRQLASIYDRWGARLLEQNVRVFLQARGGVNKGIRVTLEKSPEMFFAYNNGISATAESIEVESKSGATRIVGIRNLQIVNGGQTTASVHAAMVRKVDLSAVAVQVKLSIINPERTNEVVPKISEYANSQNRVSPADFFSNHPFHVRIETLSRRVFAPAADGSFKQSKWFYERARGQYLDARSRMSGKKLKEFDLEYPRKQLFSKTDLAKYAALWDGKPDLVSKGAQKNFAAFAGQVASQWDKDDSVYSETYFKHLVAKAIVFRAVEGLVTKQPWYDGGYRANVVAYAISKLSFDLSKGHEQFDFDYVWKHQRLSNEMELALVASATAVHEVLINPAAGKSNVTEWAKQQACWDRVQRLAVDYPLELEQISISGQDYRAAVRDGAKVQQIDSGIEAQSKVVVAGGTFWAEARAWAVQNKHISPKESDVLAICASIPRKLPTEAQAQLALTVLARLESEGYESP